MRRRDFYLEQVRPVHASSRGPSDPSEEDEEAGFGYIRPKLNPKYNSVHDFRFNSTHKSIFSPNRKESIDQLKDAQLDLNAKELENKLKEAKIKNLRVNQKHVKITLLIQIIVCVLVSVLQIRLPSSSPPDPNNSNN